MKRRDILISAVVIVAALGCILVLSQRKGYIVFSTPGTQLQLQGILFGQTLTASQQPIEVRAGTYALSSLAMRKDGQTWRITGQSPWGRIKVQPGMTTDVNNYGPPFKIMPQVSVHGGIANVDFTVLGQGGEPYNKIIKKNGKSVSAPRVRILDEQGKELASGQFAYG
jgi:hypothetical protein